MLAIGMRARIVTAIATLMATLAVVEACSAYDEEEAISVPPQEDGSPPNDTGAVETAILTDGGTSPACDLEAPFLPPEPVANVNTPSATEWCARLSPDGLELYLNVDGDLY